MGVGVCKSVCIEEKISGREVADYVTSKERNATPKSCDQQPSVHLFSPLYTQTYIHETPFRHSGLCLGLKSAKNCLIFASRSFHKFYVKKCFQAISFFIESHPCVLECVCDEMILCMLAVQPKREVMSAHGDLSSRSEISAFRMWSLRASSCIHLVSGSNRSSSSFFLSCKGVGSSVKWESMEWCFTQNMANLSRVTIHLGANLPLTMI